MFPRTHSRASFTHKNSESTHIFPNPRVLGRTFFRPQASKICERTLIMLHQSVLRWKSNKRTHKFLDPSVSSPASEASSRAATFRWPRSVYCLSRDATAFYFYRCTLTVCYASSRACAKNRNVRSAGFKCAWLFKVSPRSLYTWLTSGPKTRSGQTVVTRS